MAGMKCNKIIEYGKKFIICMFTIVSKSVRSLYKLLISIFSFLGLDGREIVTNVITTILCVSIALLIVLIGIKGGALLFDKTGWPIDDSKEITSVEAASLTIQVLVAVLVIQLTSALKKLKKSKKIINNSLLVRLNPKSQKFL